MNYSQEDLIPIVKSALTKDSIVSSTINSFDQFVNVGIEQIMKDIFELKFEIDATNTIEKDSTILKYTLEVSFDNIVVERPTHYDAVASKIVDMFPNQALMNDTTYASSVKSDVTMTAVAYHANGTTSQLKTTIPAADICKLPTMINSRLCNMKGRSNESLIQLQEDPSDLGGYFCLKGNQYLIIAMESMKHNESREFAIDSDKKDKKELCRADIISKPGDAFENSYNLVIKLMSNQSIMLNMGMAGFRDIEVPFFIFFRALGVSSAKEIIEFITYSQDESDPLVKQMMNVLQKSFTNTYTEMNNLLKNEFGSKKAQSKTPTVNVITNQEDALRLLSRCLKFYDSYKNKMKIVGEEEALNIERFLMSRLEKTLDLKFLPHIGLKESSRRKKAAYLGHMIHRLLMVQLGALTSTDRDSYKNKRINDAGMSYSRVFKTQFNFMVVMRIKKAFEKEMKNTSFADVELTSIFKNAVKPEDFEKALMNAIVSGDKTLTVNKITFKNRLSSQMLQHKNKLNVITSLRSIDTPNKGNSAKSSERAITLRQVHSTGVGYICGITSADTGAKVGMSKQLAVAATITPASSSKVLKHMIDEDSDLIPIDTVISDISSIIRCNLHKVFVNGDWRGCVVDFKTFLDRYRIKRRIGEIHQFTTVSHNIVANEIHFWTDSGRLIRPLIIVHNNMNDKNYTHDKFKQWINITDDHIEKVKKGLLDIDDLTRAGFIEWVTPEEHENLYIAYELDEFVKHLNDPLHRFTHIDIPQGNIGLVALTSVFANHNQAARIVFQTNQVKQTNGWPLKNWPYAVHKDLYMQLIAEDPLVTTFPYENLPPMCYNATVAITMCRGFNQDDSLIINKGSVDRGVFDAIRITYEKIDIEQNEMVMRPDSTATSDIKSYANYEKLINGLVQEGMYVYEGDCLVGKVAKIPKNEIKDPSITYTDRSVIYKKKEPAVVMKVIMTRNHDDREIIKIVLKSYREVELGSKFSSRSGQKGVTGFLMPEDDMPFNGTGMRPDIIFNPLSLVTRMTAGVVFEGMLAKLAALTGTMPDATMFKRLDTDGIAESLKKMGFSSNGTERLYDGMTGEWMDAMIFMGPIAYQTLQKYAIDTIHANAASPSDVLTKQPLHGKALGGGLRLGSMETSCMSVSSINFLNEKIREHSDGSEYYICRKCNHRGMIVNEDMKMYKCLYCGDHSDPIKIQTCHASRLFFDELQGMSVGAKMVPEKFQFEVNEE
jgi:DNA-directed RNA polymerase beta subunit